MSRDAKSADELLAIAEKLRRFAREADDIRYFDRFRRGAVDLELEAVGYAASPVVALALRNERSKRGLRDARS